MQDFDTTLNLCFNKKKLVISALHKLNVVGVISTMLSITPWELSELITSDCHDEELNLEYHRQRLVLLALNKTGDGQKAADRLGISVRTVYRMMADMNIKIEIKNKKKHYYIAERQIKMTA